MDGVTKIWARRPIDPGIIDVEQFIDDCLEFKLQRNF